MLRMLIVDDEARIVDGMYEVIQGSASFELEIMRAYTGFEALEQSRLARIDILLTDIHMPGMSGLQLAEHVTSLWTRCKVIFLSGYDDFKYVQGAIQCGGIDYILKIESDDKVLAAVSKAVDAIEKELADAHFMQQSKEKLHLHYPILRKAFLLELFVEQGMNLDRRTHKFAELDIRLSPRLPVLLVVGKVDRWPDHWRASDRALYRYSIQNIAEEYMQTNAQLVAFDYDASRFVWLLQPLHHDGITDEPQRWQATERFVRGTLESVQQSCRKVLQVSISLAIHHEYVTWEQVGSHFQALFVALCYGSNREEASIISPAPSDRYRQVDDQDVRQKLRQLDQLEYWLDNEQGEEIDSFLASVLNPLHWKVPEYRRQPLALEVFYMISTFWLTYLNRREIYLLVQEKLDLTPLTQMDKFASWQDTAAYHGALVRVVMELSRARKDENMDALIRRIHAYVNVRLHEELSLTRIGSYVHLNPSYLSRLYKQLTGHGLLEHITAVRLEKAKELLRYSSLKVQDIVTEVGLDSAPYFTRLFKKHVGMTPQEYREQSVKIQ